MAILHAVRNLHLVLGFWLVFALVVGVWQGPGVLPGIGALALISALVALWVRLRTWQGTVERLEMRRIKEEYEDPFTGRDTRWVERLMADVRLSDGGLITIAASSSWQVGDRIVKLRGESVPPDQGGLRPARG